MPTAVILTAFRTEFMAVRAHLTNLQEKVHPKGTVYESGKFFTKHQLWTVIIAEVGAGNTNVAIEAERAIERFDPTVLLFVGVAGGIKDVQIGDVVAATKVYKYESGKVKDQFLARPEAVQSAYSLIQRARAEARKEDWIERIVDNDTRVEPDVFIGPIAAGEKVLASKQSELFQFIRENYNDAVAIDMEGFGALSAATTRPSIEALVIRGISDLIDNKNDDTEVSEKSRQAIAARNASAFAFEVLAQLGSTQTVPHESLPETATAERVERRFCNLPHKFTPNFIGRTAETSRLLSRISDDYRQHLTVLRGIGGVGKTALALEIAYKCLEVRNNPNQSIDETQGLGFEAFVFTSSKATDLVDTKVLLRPEKEPTLPDIFRVISETLEEPTITQVPSVQQVIHVYRALRKRRTLLIVDNMETLEPEESKKVLEFLNNVPAPTQVIVTSRHYLGIDAIPIKSLTKEESLRLIAEQAAGKNVDISITRRKQLYKRFGGIPVALIYAIGQLAAGYEFSQVLKPSESLAERSDKLTEELGRFCFEASVKPLRGTATHRLLMAMTFFRDPPCREALARVAGLPSQSNHTKNSLAQLLQLSLISQQDNRYSILSITREYAVTELENEANEGFKAEAHKRWISWYLQFTKQYGNLDWGVWRAKYDQLEEEWSNIESVLYFCAAHAKWQEVLELWENIDNYVDLNGYWQKRRHWWAVIEKKIADPHVMTKALTARAWTLIMMGRNHHNEARLALDKAWRMRESSNIAVQTCIASYYACLAKDQKEYAKAHEWLGVEKELLKNSNLDNRRRMRYRARNFYYTAEVNVLEGELALAKKNYEASIEWGKKVDWQRFVNYARNGLAYILLDMNILQEAEGLLISGLEVAMSMREVRRIALYHAGCTKLHYKRFEQANKNNAMETVNIDELIQAKAHGEKALKTFEREGMFAEQEDLENILTMIHQQNYGLSQEDMNDG